LVGGRSEIVVKQGIGRGTRRCTKPEKSIYWPWELKKSDVIVWDFDVYINGQDKSEENSFPTHRHALERINIYNDIYGPVERVLLK